MITNLSQLKKAMQNKREFRIVKHSREGMEGQIRKPNVVQTNGVYTIIPTEPEHIITLANGKRGSWLEYGKAANWNFENGLCSLYTDTEHKIESFVMTIEFI